MVSKQSSTSFADVLFPWMALGIFSLLLCVLGVGILGTSSATLPDLPKDVIENFDNDSYEPGGPICVMSSDLSVESGIDVASGREEISLEGKYEVIHSTIEIGGKTHTEGNESNTAYKGETFDGTKTTIFPRCYYELGEFKNAELKLHEYNPVQYRYTYVYPAPMTFGAFNTNKKTVSGQFQVYVITAEEYSQIANSETRSLALTLVSFIGVPLLTIWLGWTILIIRQKHK